MKLFKHNSRATRLLLPNTLCLPKG
jgi:hypothetical protein